MAKKKPRLGRGLGALLNDVRTTTQAQADKPARPAKSARSADPDPAVAADDRRGAPASGFREIPIEQLQRGEYQPRVRMDKDTLNELAESIRSQGVIQPLLVRPLAPGKYEIVAGERRWRGAQLAGLSEVPAVVREITDQAAMAVGLIENIQREDLNAMEEARGYKRLLDEFGLTHQEVSEAVGCSRTAVSNLLRLLSLHPAVQKMLEAGELDMGHARALLALPLEQQPETAQKISKRGMSVRQTEHLVKSLGRGKAAARPAGRRSADIQHLEEDLSQRIGARVKIDHGEKKGKLIIHYHSLDELDGILGRIR